MKGPLSRKKKAFNGNTHSLTHPTFIVKLFHSIAAVGKKCVIPREAPSREVYNLVAREARVYHSSIATQKQILLSAHARTSQADILHLD